MRITLLCVTFAWISAWPRTNAVIGYSCQESNNAGLSLHSAGQPRFGGTELCKLNTRHCYTHTLLRLSGGNGESGSRIPDTGWESLLNKEDKECLGMGSPVYNNACGVGICLSRDAPYKVLYVKPESPAAWSNNVFEGDVLLAVDGRAVSDSPYQVVRDLCLGEESSTVSLQLARSLPVESGTEKAETVVVELTRGKEFLPLWAVKSDSELPELPLQTEAEVLGFNLSDWGRWEERIGPAGQVTYYDSYHNRTQRERPSIFKYIERWNKMTPIERARETLAQTEELTRRRAALADPEEALRQALEGEEIQELYRQYKADMLREGINLDAIPADRLTCEELDEGPDEAEWEKRGWDGEGLELRGTADWVDGNEAVEFTQEEIDRIFVGPRASASTEPHASTVAQVSVVDKLGNDLDDFVTLVEKDQQQEVKEVRDAAKGIKKTVAEMSKDIDWDKESILKDAQHNPSLQQDIKSVFGQVPQGLPESYIGLRLTAALKSRMQAEGGDMYGNPLLYGIDPLYDRLDFGQQLNAEGNTVARYVGDSVPKGYKNKHIV